MLFETTKIITSLILALGVNLVYSQKVEIGPAQTITYGYKGNYPVGDKSFFAVHYDKGTGARLIISHYTNFQKDATSGKITSKDCGRMVIDGKFFIFEERKTKGVEKVIAKEYGVDCKLVGDPKELLSYQLVSPTLPKEKTRASVIQSANKEYFAVYHEIEYQGKFRYSFKIYDKSFKLVRQGIFDCPYADGVYQIRDRVLSDSGDLFFWINNAGTKIWKLENDTLKEIKIQIKGNTSFLPKIFNDEQGIAKCFGICVETESDQKRAFVGELNFNDHSFSILKYVELPDEFIEFDEKTYSYLITDIIKRDNGEMVVVIDQYAHSSGTTMKNGVPEYTSNIIYYDIKLLALDQNYNVIWNTRLGHGNQISYFGDYSKKFNVQVIDDDYVIYLNLNKERDGMENPVPFTVSTDNRAEKNNCLGRITVDRETGESEREFLCDEIDCNLFARFVWDEYSHGLLLTFQPRMMKFRFGLISY